MADTLYEAARKAFLDADIDMLVDDLRVILIDSASYTPNFVTDTFLSSIAAGARVAVSGTMTGKTTTGGVFDADNIAFAAVGPPGTSIEAVVLYKHTGVDATSRLIEWKDQMPGLPFVANGGPVGLLWGSFVFSLGASC